MNRILLKIKEKFYLSRGVINFKKFDRVFRKYESELIRMKLNNKELLCIKYIRDFVLEFNSLKARIK